MNRLAWVRRCVAAVVLVVFVLSFVQAAPAGSWLYSVERVQFVPALMASVQGRTWGWVALGSLLVLTLLLGRVYCSWLCPLGMLQDVVNRLRHPRPQARQGKGVRWTPNHWVIRSVVALLVFGSVPVAGTLLLTWLDPYSIAARLMAAVVHPAAAWAAQAAGWEGAPPDWLRYVPWLMVLLLLGVVLPLAMAWWRGRLYCNTLCPVGAVLGLLARLAPLTPQVDPDRCGRCGSCLRECKAHAIDLKNLRVDSTRCVGCYNCIATCARGAMRLRWHVPSVAKRRGAVRPEGGTASVIQEPKPLTEDGKLEENREKNTAEETAGKGTVNMSRRAFLGWGMTGLACAVLPEVKSRPSRDVAAPGTNVGPAAVPPGAEGLEHLLRMCTGCGLCISSCPTHVLRPSYTVLGWRGVMKPYLDYTVGYCDPSCHTCSRVCPVGALRPLTLEEKKRTQIGLVSYRQAHCRIWKEQEDCALCADACPTGAISAVMSHRPLVREDKCVGCKAKRCYNACPTGSISFVTREDSGRRLAVIHYETCIGCGYCAEACTRYNGIDVQEVRTLTFSPELCNGCGICEHVCPSRPKAVEVQPRMEHLPLG